MVIDLFYEFDSRFVIAQDSGKAERQQPRYKRITRETFFGDRESVCICILWRLDKFFVAPKNKIVTLQRMAVIAVF